MMQNQYIYPTYHCVYKTPQLYNFVLFKTCVKFVIRDPLSLYQAE